MPPDAETIARLARTRTIDLTTTGRRSGRPSRIEIWWFHVDGRFIVTGTPGPRDWYANVLAAPEVLVHSGGRDHPGLAAPIFDPVFRHRVFTHPTTAWYATQTPIDALVATSPMVEIHLV